MRSFLLIIFLTLFLSGCALITTPVKVVGVAAKTTIKVTGAIVAAPFKMVGNDDKEDEKSKEEKKSKKDKRAEEDARESEKK